MIKIASMPVIFLLLSASVAAAPDEKYLWDFPFDHFTSFRERPLFSPDRKTSYNRLKAPAVESSNDDIVEDAALNVRLVGVLVDENGVGTVFIAENGSDRIYSLGIGHSIQGWTLVRITPKFADFRTGDRSVSVLTPAGVRGSISQ